MSQAVAVKCKTQDCGTWLKLGEVPDNRLRSHVVLLRFNEEEFKATCPKCKKEHVYSAADEGLYNESD